MYLLHEHISECLVECVPDPRKSSLRTSEAMQNSCGAARRKIGDETVTELQMANIPSLDDALRDVPAAKLDQECSDDDLYQISQSLTRWTAVSPWLGLTEADEEEIRVERALERQRIDVLRKWKAKQRDRATYR